MSEKVTHFAVVGLDGGVLRLGLACYCPRPRRRQVLRLNLVRGRCSRLAAPLYDATESHSVIKQITPYTGNLPLLRGRRVRIVCGSSGDV